ncbi:MAG: hypothetical protein QOF87_2322 [Pseudonocardiales bacterium]|nr:hypothetical protein [Pseudonocardiales bacterium]
MRLRSACVQDFSDVDESEQSGVHVQHRKSLAGADAVIQTGDSQRAPTAADIRNCRVGRDLADVRATAGAHRRAIHHINVSLE